MESIKKTIRRWGQKVIKIIYPELAHLNDSNINWDYLKSTLSDSFVDKRAKLYDQYHIYSSKIDSFTYISGNSNIANTTIGKFCSIGPNFISGWGIHPTNGISTAPMFYSTMKQNGFSLSKMNKVEEGKPIIIGNDVFIGANVTVLNGITIGDGAIIGAGAVVSKDIPPYAIAVGVPIKILKYRFREDQISKLLKIRWWEFDDENLNDVEKLFFEIDKFIHKHDTTQTLDNHY